MTIPESIIKLHEDLVEFGSDVQEKSAKRMDTEGHIEENVYSVFHKITAYAITIHRAILELCISGWTHITAVLLRTLMECSVNCLAIVNNEFSEYMAFKYLYYSDIQIMLDENFTKDTRKDAKIKIENAIKKLNDASLQEKLNNYVNSDKLDIFWFKPEENGISSIINKYGDGELKFVYRTFSMSAHAGHSGLFFLKDDPDEISINPCKNPMKSKLAIISSCRFLLEFLDIRNSYEKLGCDSEYDKFIKRILEFKKAR